MTFNHLINGLLTVILFGPTIAKAEQFVTNSIDLMHQSVQVAIEGGLPSTSEFLVWNEDRTSLLVQVIAVGPGAEDRLASIFDDINFEKTGCSTYMCSGFVPAQGFSKLEAHNQVKFIRPELFEVNQAGQFKSEAVKALRVDLVRNADRNITGEGITVCVISNSLNVCGDVCATDYADDIASLDLPPGIVRLKEGFIVPNQLPDEGRAMMQLIHDLAPDAKLKFYSGSYGAISMALGIYQLADARCNVIVDDIGYFTEPFFQDGVIAQAANDVAELRGVAYFSSAGNNGEQSWEGSFTGSGMKDDFGCEFHDYGGGKTRQRLQYERSGGLVFQWDDPFFSVSGDTGPNRRILILYLYDGTTGEVLLVNRQKDPDPLINLLLATNDQGNVDLAFSVCEPKKAGSVFVKWIAFRISIKSIEFDTKSSTSFGHPNTKFTAGVGAAFFNNTPAFGTNPPQVEDFSSSGGTPIFFERDGTRKSEALKLKQPRFVGPDGNFNSFFGDRANFEPNGPGFYFFGTSAAAPNVAAVAALMLQVNPNLSPTEIYQVLEQTAINMNTPGFDFKTGYGLVDALAAVKVANNPPCVKTEEQLRQAIRLSSSSKNTPSQIAICAAEIFVKSAISLNNTAFNLFCTPGLSNCKLNAQNQNRLFVGAPVLANFTKIDFVNANATSDEKGGALFLADEKGGALFLAGEGTVNFFDTGFFNNDAKRGGAMYVDSAEVSVTIQNSLFHSNTPPLP